MNVRRLTLFVFSIMLLSYCSTGFTREERSYPSAGYQVDVASIHTELQRRPQLRFPTRIAVFLDQPPTRRGEAPWRFTASEIEQVTGLEEELRAAGVASQLFLMTEQTAILSGLAHQWDQANLETIRLLAARHGAEAVLVISGESRVTASANPLSIMYLTVAGVWLIPGSHRDALFYIRASLWDVRNQFLYASVQAEGEATQLRPYGFISEESVVESAKSKAFADFTPELRKRLLALK
ncbi:hypothetical protein [Leptonema illini]|uniref:Lipoprotein n=1 Tax=Leptonema illini DSM 21528 TaxID=929563 RepID=H2CER6_9LEPT|nr:hypothetical protein [Leptonema illini]EHQ06678.1 hypothetical protein Lepil_1997 [Leptonema illini DSM 21528]